MPMPFWANISADYHEQEAYPTGRRCPGGVTDKLLSDYPNLFADTSANSANNALSRDPEFTRDFLRPAPGQAALRQRLPIAMTARAGGGGAELRSCCAAHARQVRGT